MYSADVQEDLLIFELEGGSILRNVGIQLPHDEEFYPRRMESTATPLRKLQKLQSGTAFEKQQPVSVYNIAVSKTGHTARHDTDCVRFLYTG